MTTSTKTPSADDDWLDDDNLEDAEDLPEPELQSSSERQAAARRAIEISREARELRRLLDSFEGEC